MVKIKKKQCRACKVKFTPWTTVQVACSPRCALEVVRAAKEKKEKREQREAKQSLKTVYDRIADAQKAFNKWIRYRDREEPCISCGRYEGEIKHDSRGGKMDCGHFHSTGARPELRFNEDNAHKQCKSCNRDKSGNHGAYRLSLINKIGPERVEALDSYHNNDKWDKDELIEIKKDYQRRLRES